MNKIDYIEKDKKMGIEYFKQAAEKGCHKSMFELGNSLFEDQTSDAIQYYQKSASLGNIEALFKLGSLYELGCKDIIVKNLDKSVECYEKAVELGSVECIPKVAAIYQRNSTTNKDFIHKAIKYYEKGVSLGCMESAQNLSLIYQFGCGGIEKNLERANELRNLQVFELSNYQKKETKGRADCVIF